MLCTQSDYFVGSTLILKPSRTLWGLQAQKPFCVPCFLFVGNKFQPPGPSLSSKWQVQTVANQEKEERKSKGGEVKKQKCSLGRILVPAQGIHITIFLSSSAELKSSTNGKC